MEENKQTEEEPRESGWTTYKNTTIWLLIQHLQGSAE